MPVLICDEEINPMLCNYPSYLWSVLKPDHTKRREASRSLLDMVYRYELDLSLQKADGLIRGFSQVTRHARDEATPPAKTNLLAFGNFRVDVRSQARSVRLQKNY